MYKRFPFSVNTWWLWFSGNIINFRPCGFGTDLDFIFSQVFPPLALYTLYILKYHTCIDKIHLQQYMQWYFFCYFFTFTGMQKIIKMRSAVANPPRKIFVGVDGSGRNFGHNVDAIITIFPIKIIINYCC